MWIAFTDGACSGNPGPGGWGAILWHADDDEVFELGGGKNPTTNNQMELIAVEEALKFVSDRGDLDKRVIVVSDSSYVVKGLESWVPNWKHRGWNKQDGQAVQNLELWKNLDRIASDFSNLKLLQVLGHSGLAENERADEVAVSYSMQENNFELYCGPRSKHPRRVFSGINADNAELWVKSAIERAGKNSPSKKSSKTTKAPGSYYISIVDGTLERHTEWASCEERVKGKSQAKFKKVKNAAEEEEFLAKHRFKQ